MTNKTTGKYGEELACQFLTKNGFKVLEKNFRYSKMAEIDIVALKNDIIHFVEVKTRTQTFFGNPLEAITKAKLESIYKCALYYIQNNKKYTNFQIDAIGIVLNKNNETEINFIENININ